VQNVKREGGLGSTLHGACQTVSTGKRKKGDLAGTSQGVPGRLPGLEPDGELVSYMDRWDGRGLGGGGGHSNVSVI